jgi:uncharacterized protein YdaU (DUF1376 family)
MRFRGVMWWVDRWRKSTSFMDMNLEQQGAYRNLLDECCLRGGAIPDDERLLAKACGDPRCWKRVKTVVMRRFKLGVNGWHNETLDEVLTTYMKRVQKQATRGSKPGAKSGVNPGAEAVLTMVQTAGDLDLESTEIPPTPPFQGGHLTRQQLKMAEMRRARVHGGCPHEPRCTSYAACVEQLARDVKVGQR